MTLDGFHVAQANVARMRAPLDHPSMAEFVARLAPDSWPGFVWRLQTEEGDATAIRAFDDPLILFNMSVWESLEVLKGFVYRGSHLEVFQERQRWFLPFDRIPHVLWWVRAGHRPTVEEAKARFESLWSLGPTERAFTFARVALSADK
jgi:hypothetical protein